MFTVGEPSGMRVSRCGRRVVFLRADGDARGCRQMLCVVEVDEGLESLVEHSLSPTREATDAGQRLAFGYSANDDLTVAAVAAARSLTMIDLRKGRRREIVAEDAVVGPVPDPTGLSVAYDSAGSVHIADIDGADRVLISSDDPNIEWGVAESLAREELGRHTGLWWSADGRRIATTRVDSSAITAWYVADPGDPRRVPVEQRYAAAGGPIADVSLWLYRLDDVPPIAVHWDRRALPYLVDVRWSRAAPLAFAAQARDQRRIAWIRVDPATGATEEFACDRCEPWTSIAAGSYGWLGDGVFVRTAVRDDTRRLFVGDDPVTPPELEVRSIAYVGEDAVVFHANEPCAPSELHVWRWSAEDGARRLTHEPGVHRAAAGGDTIVLQSRSLRYDGLRTTVLRAGEPAWTIPSRAEQPVVDARPKLMRVACRRLPAALLLPTGDRNSSKLPVIVSSYSGPSVQKVVHARRGYLTEQWLADQGFAVVVIDGRGTPGLGATWEHAVAGDLASQVLEDQVDGLLALARRHPHIDLTRVGIRGWSFGGYLAILAVLRRPDVFHAAVAGAPVTDWRLYDAHYSERFLGSPQECEASYERSSLLADAYKLRRPLLLMHGLDDRNVPAAHSYRLSAALAEAGRAHTFVPLAGVGHMPEISEAAVRVAMLELNFLRSALAADDSAVIGARP